ncbi:MAG: sugar kinase [Pseudomonadota bacterium]
MTAKSDIVSIGEALIEFLEIPQMQDNRPLYSQGFGGDTSNAMIAAARQGASTGYISAVGGDPFGDLLIELWQREGVSSSDVIKRPHDPTGVYFVQPHPSGRSFSYARRGSAASLYGPDDLPATTIASAGVLHVSALSQAISTTMREAITEAAGIARKNGTLVSYDTNLRLNLWSLELARETIEAFLPLADIVFPSDDEAIQLTGLSDPDAIADHYLGYGAKIVVLKRGGEGALLATPDMRQLIKSHKVEAIDSTGAGDSYAGSFLAYFLETGDPVVAARRAAIVAAGTVSGYGAIDPVPYRDAVLAVEED